MAVVSYGKVRVWILIWSLCGLLPPLPWWVLCGYSGSLPYSKFAGMGSKCPQRDVFLHCSEGCGATAALLFPMLFVSGQARSSQPSWILKRTPFSCSLLTCVVPDDFFMKRSCICQRHQPPRMHAVCQRTRSLSDNSSAPLGEIIHLHRNYRIIDHYNETKAFIGAKEKAPRGSESGVAKSRRSNW